MRNLSRLIALILVVSAPAHAEPTKIAVFDFELVDTSLQGEVDGPRADEQRRLREAGDQLRKALADSGKFIVLDIAPVHAAAHASNLQAFAGCHLKNPHPPAAGLATPRSAQTASHPIRYQ